MFLFPVGLIRDYTCWRDILSAGYCISIRLWQSNVLVSYVVCAK